MDGEADLERALAHEAVFVEERADVPGVGAPVWRKYRAIRGRSFVPVTCGMRDREPLALHSNLDVGRCTLDLVRGGGRRDAVHDAEGLAVIRAGLPRAQGVWHEVTRSSLGRWPALDRWRLYGPGRRERRER